MLGGSLESRKKHISWKTLFIIELVVRGYSVDVGVVKIEKINDKGIRSQKALEIDFVVNRGAKKYYIQSALALPDEDKTKQELRPLLSVKDCFR